ncbi:hypothetical protein L2734_19525, partial [Parashewanella spongiae]
MVNRLIESEQQNSKHSDVEKYLDNKAMNHVGYTSLSPFTLLIILSWVNTQDQLGVIFRKHLVIDTCF